MGARPSSFKKGGGWLNDVVATITGYQFTDEFAGKPFSPGKIKGTDGKTIDKPHTLNVLVSFRLDGADEDVTQTLKAAGDYTVWEVSEDGHTVTHTEDSTYNLPASTAFFKLINTLVHPTDGGEGFPEERLPEDAINYEAVIGTRVRLVQLTDDERTKKYGLKKDKKTGKSYERKDLVVAEVLELPTVEVEGKANGKAAKPAKTAKAAGKGKPAKTEEVDVDELASETLLAILEEAEAPVAKSKLSMKVLTKLMKHPQREDVRKRIFDEEFLGQDGAPWAYDRSKQVVTALA